MGSSKGPPAPDYVGAAVAQGEANTDAAIVNAGLNRVDQYGPDGSTTWSLREGADAKNPKPGDWTQTTALSAEQQGLKDKSNLINNSLLNTGTQQLDKVNASFNNNTVGQGLMPWANAPQQTVRPATGGGGWGLDAGAGGGYQQGLAREVAARGAYPQGMQQGQPPQAASRPAVPQGAYGGYSSLAEAQSGMPTSSGSQYDYAGYIDNGYGDNSPVSGGGSAGYGSPQPAGVGGGFGGGRSGLSAAGMNGGRLPQQQQQGQGGYSSGNGYSSGTGSRGPMTPGVASANGFGPANYGGTDYNAGRDAVAGALMSRLQPQQYAARQAMESKLINSGITPGSAAWDGRMRQLGQQENDASMGAILAGGQEQTRLGNMYNTTRAQDLSQDQAAYSQGLAGASFNNANRQAQLQEQSYLQNIDLNNLNALRTGTQVNSPQFGSYYTAGTSAGDLLGATTSMGQWNSAEAARQQSAQNSNTQAAAGTAAMMAMYAFSDIRLKKNIRRIGLHPAGVGRYAWDWKDGSGRDYGVLAQELQAIRPDAVHYHSSGMLMVDYASIGGR